MLLVHAGEDCRCSQAEPAAFMPRRSDIVPDAPASLPVPWPADNALPVCYGDVPAVLPFPLSPLPLRIRSSQSPVPVVSQRSPGFQFLRLAPPPMSPEKAVKLPALPPSAASNPGRATLSISDRRFAFKKEWSFEVVASLMTKPWSLASDVIAAVDFDETGTKFATGGIARKIRVCSYSSLVNPDEVQEDEEQGPDDDFEEERQTGPHGSRMKRHSRKRRRTPSSIHNHDEASLRIICTPAKLSSLKWRPLGSDVIGCGDYDGVVTEWDVEQGLCLCERYEHSGQRIWSVDYSPWFPTLCSSASGDGTVRLWTQNCDRSIGVIRSSGRNSICCAEFSTSGPHSVAIACANSNVYLYDLRRLDSSLLCLQGHARAASYVRFMNNDELVSASIDSTVKLWDASNASAMGNRRRDLSLWYGATLAGRGEGRHVRTFGAHRNVKNFVGLAVSKEGLISCGSESNEVFVYDKSHAEPIWRMKFPTTMGDGLPQENSAARMQCLNDRGNSFVGAVCWREQGDHRTLVTANSEGTVQIIKVCSSA